MNMRQKISVDGLMSNTVLEGEICCRSKPIELRNHTLDSFRELLDITCCLLIDIPHDLRLEVENSKTFSRTLHESHFHFRREPRVKSALIGGLVSALQVSTMR